MGNFTFQKAAPESQGVTSRAIMEWVHEISKLDSVNSYMLLRHDRVISQAWWEPYKPEYHHELFSISKSFVSAAIGIAQGEGLLKIGDRLVDFFPEEASPLISERMKRVTLRHLLSMSSGHRTCPMGMIKPQTNWVREFLISTLEFEPGTHFAYNTAGSYMLAAVIRKVSGENVLEYLQSRLFHPLGIRDAKWDTCPLGTSLGGWGLWLKTEDILRFGRLLLHEGNWNGTQLIPADYVREAVSFQIDNSANHWPDWKLGYGFQFWRTSFNSFRADGACGQYILVMPEKDLVLAVNSGLSNMQDLLTLFWKTVYPELSDGPLPENPEMLKELNDLENSRRIPPPAKTPAALIPDGAYSLAPNTLGLDGVEFRFAEEYCTVVLQWHDREPEELTAGYGVYLQNRIQLDDDEIRITEAGAAWLSDNTLMIQVCSVETPYRDHYFFRFCGGALEMDRESNLYFLHRKWPRLTGLSANIPVDFGAIFLP